jgi:hypothetical protein
MLAFCALAPPIPAMRVPAVCAPALHAFVLRDCAILYLLVLSCICMPMLISDIPFLSGERERAHAVRARAMRVRACWACGALVQRSSRSCGFRSSTSPTPRGCAAFVQTLRTSLITIADIAFLVHPPTCTQMLLHALSAARLRFPCSRCARLRFPGSRCVHLLCYCTCLYCSNIVCFSLVLLYLLVLSCTCMPMLISDISSCHILEK